MPFPTSIEGAISAPIAVDCGLGVDGVAMALEQRMKAQGVSTVRDGAALRFTNRYRGGNLMADRSNVFMALDSGALSVAIEDGRALVRYRAATVRQLVFAATVALLAALFTAILGFKEGAAWMATPLAVVTLMAAWLIGGGYVLTRARLARWLRRELLAATSGAS